MHRFRRVASALAAIILAAVLAPVADPAPTVAAGECGTYQSDTAPPPTIRVYRTASGAVDTVDFRTYVKNVLSREWISSWTTESLRSGALAVKNYGWYQVIHWRGYVNGAGSCFDVFDSTNDQHYDPSRPTYPSMAAAVDATWGTLAHRHGRIFATYYNAGQPNEACGAGANGWQMFQWGTQACGLVGKSAAEIMAIYYPGVSIIAAPPPATPPPATPAPTPTGPPPRARRQHPPRRRALHRPPARLRCRPPPRRRTRLQPALRWSCPAAGRPGSPHRRLLRRRILSRSWSASAPAVARPLRRRRPACQPPPTATVAIADMGGHAVVQFERTADAAALRSRVTPVRSVPATLRLLVMQQLIERALAELPMGARPGS